MFIIKALTTFLGIVLIFGSATLVSAADDANKTLADTVSSFEKTALPPLIASRDYWTASKVYFQIAIAHSHMDEAEAACIALSRSQEYYRAALAKDHLSLAYFGDMASDGSEAGIGMQEMRSKLGCENKRVAQR
jgi:hypothetical protein